MMIQTTHATPNYSRENQTHTLNHKVLIDLELEGLVLELFQGRSWDFKARNEGDKNLET